MNYGPEFRDLTRIANLFHHHEDRDKIMDIIQRGPQCHISPIERGTSNSNLSATILGGNHKSSKTDLNATDLEKNGKGGGSWL